tara:strand:- start:279 stop:839 length:561 start_codon:yes stop_codon:yes gene_type:complete
MRIISGKLKGKSIQFLKNKTTRPLKDVVRENIFNILNHSNEIKIDIEKANILDLYSGVGSFGLECISRGARKVTFIEQDIKASEVLKDNLVKLSIMNQAEIINDRIENAHYLNKKLKYSIFFLDPPFADKEFINSLKIIKMKKIFIKNHVVIIHRERGSNDNLKEFLNVISVRQYGRSKIIFATFN